MAVTITKSFWDGSTYKDISKIVFTSGNIEGPAVAGTRSHAIPGSPYIATWYEAVDYMYRIKNNQQPPTYPETYFYKGVLKQSSFDFSTDTTMRIGLRESYLFSSGQVLFASKSDFATISGVTSSTVSGTDYPYIYDIALTSTTGSGIINQGDSLYFWGGGTNIWATATTSIIFQVTNGEAYNCRLTAWDDNTHSTTNNKILTDLKYKVTCCAYKADDGTKESPVNNNSSDSMVHPPGIDIPLSGNSNYYGDFDLRYIANGGATGNEHGEYLIFTPRLDNIDTTFTPGNYDFVTTLHYQYT